MAASFILRTASDCFTVTPVIAGNISNENIKVDEYRLLCYATNYLRVLQVRAFHTANLFK